MLVPSAIRQRQALEPQLSARGITHRFGERTVLDGVDLDVPAGRVIGLLGPNGAGKTTLMRILFGVLAADAGTLEWQGRAVTTTTAGPGATCRRNAGSTATCGCSISWCGSRACTGSTRRRARDGARRCSRQLDLAERERDKISSLSGGMAQRVQLAAAMVHGPDLLVLDEPFAGPRSGRGAVPLRRHHRAHPRRRQPPLLEPPARPGRGPLRDDHPAPPRPGRAARRRPHAEGREPEPLAAGRRGGRPVVARRRGVARSRSIDASGTRLRLAPRRRSRARCSTTSAATRAVDDFGVEAPSLSELFLEATGVGEAA